MTGPAAATRDRQMFVNGERLRISVEPPPGGGGTHYEPQTAAEAQALLLPRVREVVARLTQLPREYRGERLYLETQLLPNYLAPSHYPGALLAEIGAATVGSRAAPSVYRTKRRETETITRRLILAIDDAGLERLQNLVVRPGAGRSQQTAFAELRKLDDVGTRAPDDVIMRMPEETDELITWEAVLHPSAVSEGQPFPLSEEGVEQWFALVERSGGQAHRDYVRRVGGLTFAPITLGSAQALAVARFNPLRAMRPMPAIRPTPGISIRSAPAVRPPVAAGSRVPSPAVAVFDGGVDNAVTPSPFFPAADVELTTAPAEFALLAHGTGVVGASLYGLLDPGAQAPQPALPLTSYRSLPTPAIPGLDQYWLLDKIKEEVSGGNYRIVNLSLGPDISVEDTNEPDRWTAELDTLASELDVLFVVAAGNNGLGDRATGLHRVQVPADMVNGLAVGACDAPPPRGPWNRSEYSAMGPGRHGNRVQPSGVQFGGDCGTNRFPLLTASGGFTESDGTSFAAPLVTHALSNLTTRLPSPTASVLRCFAVHFAERWTRRHAYEELGYGRFPLSFDADLACDPDEVHVLYEDEIDDGDLLGYRIPVPADLAAALELRLSLVYSSPTEPTQPTEYTRVSLDLTLRPHEYRHGFNPPRGSGLRRQVLDLRTDEATEMLHSGWTVSQEPATRSLGTGPRSPEIDLRDGGKWETVRHHLLRFRPEEIENPRIELTYLARRNGRLVHESEPVRFALLMSIKDRSGSGQLYDSVAAQFPALRALTPIGSRVRVRGRARQ